MELYHMYRPITATPFRNCETYMEFEPCDALKPYIRCFWGSPKTVRQEKGDAVIKQLVIPDTCADIIFTVDFTNNKIENRFNGIGDETFTVQNANHESKTIFSFAIRFYAWGVTAFAEESMKDTKNTFFDTGYHFSKIKKEIEKHLFDATDICQLISVAEGVLLKHLHGMHQNQTVLHAIHKILENRGNLLMTDLNREVLIGNRQLERLFREYVGVSPKSLASMVRYQYLWNELLYNKNFNIQDAIYRYGYSDQAHLCHDFKKFHSMNMTDARKFAIQNVENIQDADF